MRLALVSCPVPPEASSAANEEVKSLCKKSREEEGPIPPKVEMTIGIRVRSVGALVELWRDDFWCSLRLKTMEASLADSL